MKRRPIMGLTRPFNTWFEAMKICPKGFSPDFQTLLFSAVNPKLIQQEGEVLGLSQAFSC